MQHARSTRLLAVVALAGLFMAIIAPAAHAVMPVPYVQDFEVDAAGWETGAGTYGAITQVASGTGGINSSGGTGHAVVDSELETSECLGAGSHDCFLGPFTRFGGYADEFPGTFSTEIDVYLDPGWAPGTGFDYSVAANGSDDNHQRDFILHVGVHSDGRLLVNGSNNSDFRVNDFKLVNDGDGTPLEIDTAGWYTLRHVFREASDGSLAVDLVLADPETGDVLFITTRNNPADQIPAEVGGNRYGWFTFVTEDIALPVDNQELCLAAACTATEFTEHSQGFEDDRDDWFDETNGWAGTVTRVPSGTNGIDASEGGTYAAFTETFVTGTGETGPFSRFSGYSNLFPGTFVAEVDAYLDPEWPVGTGFDYSVAANGTDGSHRRDFIFHVGVHSDGRLLVNGSNNSDFAVNDFKLVNDGDGTPLQIMEAGWYTLRHTFRNDGGELAVDLQVVDAEGNILFTTTRKQGGGADLIPSLVGANRYAWFTFIAGDLELPVDNFELCLTGPSCEQPDEPDPDPGGGGPVVITPTDEDPDEEEPTTEPAQAPEPERLGGGERIETAVLGSQETFEGGTADAVVLARSDDPADAVAGTPFSVAVGGPLLLTQSETLTPITLEEIQRVLPDGGTVYILGGTAAVSQQVEDDLVDAGYEVVRRAGPNRFATAATIADSILALGSFAQDGGQALIADGGGFTSATVAGVAAAHIDGLVLLTAGDQAAPETQQWLADHPDVTATAIGAEAAMVYPAGAISADTPEGVSVAVAEEFFDESLTSIGVATSAAFPDPLTGGVHIAHRDGALLLSTPEELPQVVGTYLESVAGQVTDAFIYGGTAALSTSVAEDVEAALTPAAEPTDAE